MIRRGCVDFSLEKPVKQKTMILEELKKQGCRITNQRKLIIDVILNSECTCCKEIYWEVNQKDSGVGIATVYRMVRALEEMGAINRRIQCKELCEGTDMTEGEYIIMFKNQDTVELSAETWVSVIKAGLNAVCGLRGRDIDSVVMKNPRKLREVE